MATARAVITTDVPGCRHTVVHGINGLLVQPRDADALAAAMIELATDADRLRSMGDAGRARVVQDFELGRVVRATADLIEGIEPVQAVESR